MKNHKQILIYSFIVALQLNIFSLNTVHAEAGCYTAVRSAFIHTTASMRKIASTVKEFLKKDEGKAQLEQVQGIFAEKAKQAESKARSEGISIDDARQSVVAAWEQDVMQRLERFKTEAEGRPGLAEMIALWAAKSPSFAVEFVQYTASKKALKEKMFARLRMPMHAENIPGRTVGEAVHNLWRQTFFDQSKHIRTSEQYYRLFSFLSAEVHAAVHPESGFAMSLLKAIPKIRPTNVKSWNIVKPFYEKLGESYSRRRVYIESVITETGRKIRPEVEAEFQNWGVVPTIERRLLSVAFKRELYSRELDQLVYEARKYWAPVAGGLLLYLEGYYAREFALERIEDYKNMKKGPCFFTPANEIANKELTEEINRLNAIKALYENEKLTQKVSEERAQFIEEELAEITIQVTELSAKIMVCP